MIKLIIDEATCCIPAKTDYLPHTDNSAKKEVYYFGKKPDPIPTLKDYMKNMKPRKR